MPSMLYPTNLILNPPAHTKLEIDKLISLIDKKSKRVVDFGAGTGRLTIPLLKRGLGVTAVDVSQNSLEKLKQTARKLRLGRKLKTDKAIKTGETVVGCDILHHVHLEKYLKLFYEKLPKNGQIIFSEPNGWNIFWYLLIFLKLDWGEERGVTKINYFNLIRLLKRIGFNGTKIEGLGILPGPFCLNNSVLCRINYWWGNLPLIKLLAYRLIISARKD